MTLDTSLARNLLGVRRSRTRPGHPGRRSADREPLSGWVPTLCIGLLIAFSDWTSKAVVTLTIPENGFREVIDGRLAFWHVRNPAMILGLYGDLSLGVRKTIALAAALAGLALMLQVIACGHRLPREHRPWAWLFVGLVLGGMLGNLGERVLHWGVTDFISIGWGGTWLPPGNIADLALFASIPMACLVCALELLARTRRGAAAPESVPAAAEAMGD